MLLAIDIGNTSIVFGLFKGDKLLRKDRLPTKSAYSPQKCRRAVTELFRAKGIDEIIISSVVPDALRALEAALDKVLKIRPLVVGRDVSAPIKNQYEKPKQVGQDRLVNAVAAAALYKNKKVKYTVIIDFGTAVTFDVVSMDRGYLGGLIFPGIRLSLENLVRRAALLPKVSIKDPVSLIGRDTKDSMRSGILNGYGSLCDGIVGRIERSLGERVMVIATGGDAAVIARHSKTIKKIDGDLTLKGLHTIANGKNPRNNP